MITSGHPSQCSEYLMVTPHTVLISSIPTVTPHEVVITSGHLLHSSD